MPYRLGCCQRACGSLDELLLRGRSAQRHGPFGLYLDSVIIFIDGLKQDALQPILNGLRSVARNELADETRIFHITGDFLCDRSLWRDAERAVRIDCSRIFAVQIEFVG